MSKRIVILGGMGPQASLLLHGMVVREAQRRGAVNNEDYPEILHLSVPVKDFIGDNIAQSEALDQLTGAIIDANVSCDDTVILACNTAHLLEDALNARTGIRLHSLIKATIKEVKRQRFKNIGILGTPTTIQTGLYARACEREGVATCTLAPDEAQCLEEVIRGVIAGKSNDDSVVLELIEKLRARGAESVILGCTELSVIAARRRFNNVLDPLQIITKALLLGEE